MLRFGALAWLVFAAACAAVGDTGTDAGSSVERSIAFTFVPELPASSDELYVCFAFDADRLGAAILSGVSWTEPSGGSALHHAKLYATAEQRPMDGAFDCGPMPEDAITLHVWARGGSALVLPEGMGLQLPAEMRTLVVEAHALRVSGEPAGEGQVSLALASRPPDALATWLALRAPVPALRPGTRESSSARCRFGAELHAVLAWPHMHRMGIAFTATRLRDAEETTLVEVDPWDFEAQRAYPVAIDLAAGDAVAITCTWLNSTPEYVLPGPLTENEMCGLGLVGWPAEAAVCDVE